MRARNGKFTNVEREQAKARLVYEAAIAAGYVEAARPVRNVFHFTATGAQMLDMIIPHAVVGRKIIPQADGIARGKVAGRVGLWAGVSLI